MRWILLFVVLLVQCDAIDNIERRLDQCVQVTK